nr:reverse transcriptase domain-containing protein [Tanacetum cinerariifolium]
MKGKSSSGSKQTPAKNPDALVTKGELGRQKKPGKLQKRLRKRKEAQRDGCGYKAFLNCNQAEFYGDSDPVIVTNWLKEIEDMFEISEFLTRQMVKYASYLLKGEARHWWDIIKITRGDDVASVMKWEEFEDLVMENYCPQGLMDKLEEEFLKL